MEKKHNSEKTNSDLKLNLLKILVHTLTIVMILGIVIIVSIILKEFFLTPKKNNQFSDLPKSIKIPNGSKLEFIDLKDNNFKLIVSSNNGKQQIIILTFEDGVEKSRKYININNIK